MNSNLTPPARTPADVDKIIQDWMGETALRWKVTITLLFVAIIAWTKLSQDTLQELAALHAVVLGLTGYGCLLLARSRHFEVVVDKTLSRGIVLQQHKPSKQRGNDIKKMIVVVLLAKTCKWLAALCVLGVMVALHLYWPAVSVALRVVIAVVVFAFSHSVLTSLADVLNTKYRVDEDSPV